MRPIDTIFIILAFSYFLKHPKQKYFISILPILVFLVSFLNAYIPASIEPFVIPIIAILICFSCLELAPVSLLLLFSDFENFWEALIIPIIWFLVTAIMKHLKTRIDDEYIPTSIRGLPIRIISLGILYSIFYPLSLI